MRYDSNLGHLVKLCPACKLEKPTAEFYWQGSNTLHFRPLSKCISCHKACNKAWRGVDKAHRPDSIRDSYKRYYLANKEKVKAAVKARRARLKLSLISVPQGTPIAG